MKRFTLLFLALVATVGFAFGQDADAEMMKKWQKAMTPNENHEFLAKMAGEWTYTQKGWMDPTQEPTVSEGKTSAKMIMGGRYLDQYMSGTAWGMPFEGQEIMGYDNLTGKFRSHWIDNMGTGFLISEGTLEGNTLTMIGTAPSMMSDGMDTYKMVTVVESEDSHSMTMYMVSPDGEEMKAMEIVATRKK